MAALAQLKTACWQDLQTSEKKRVGLQAAAMQLVDFLCLQAPLLFLFLLCQWLLQQLFLLWLLGLGFLAFADGRL